MWTDLDELEPAGPTVSAILSFEREKLVAEILRLNDASFFEFSDAYLRTLGDRQLRRVLFAVRRHHRNRDY